MDEKMYDILLLGSTGYTGQMVLEYFLKKYEEKICNGDIKLLCAVRNVNKLNDILLSIKEKENITSTEKVYKKEFDVGNYDSIVSCCNLCKVVISIVGPYATYGYNIVKACVESNCHYVDVCGEHTFILKIYKEFNEIAKKKKLKIIHSASFISAISDLGTFIIQEEFLKRYKQPCPYVRIRLSAEGRELRTIGKSTIKSFLQFKKDVQNGYNKHYLCENKYDQVFNEEVNSYLNEKMKKETSFFDYEKEFGYCFGTNYSQAEEAYVLWSNYLLNYKYGKNLIISYQQYDAHLTTPMYIVKKFSAIVKNIFSSLVTFVLQPFGIGNYLMGKYVDWLHTPKTSHELRRASWLCTIVGQSYSLDNVSKDIDVVNNHTVHTKGNLINPEHDTYEENNKTEKKIFLHLSGKNEDPGYLLSAKVISESALSLFETGKLLPDTFGVISVSVGLGQIIVDRLRQSELGMRIELS
ncbi:hypothetical protein, conserved [Plasmodium gonderi]|uniref:Saccharopine dehydrogenase NADP binding domain-containing protein n=1 Tax=Plasmodium gonderi TaxID=77519 RepID=A0A1Y1JF98_PLAGO|nr:hypothetical protein, conserved [Plasmodium gonderi]GAW79422.1 hypothetical protein, conserved [Plasmodium gonderi]